jgi:hypothetical protein
MTVEAPDLPLCLSRHHFFCASLYSPPRPGILSLIVRRVFALICSPYHFVHVVLHSFAPLSHALFPSFGDHLLPLSCRVVSAAGLWRGAAEFVFACELVLVLFLEFQLLRRAHREGSCVVKDECSSTALEL